MTDAPKTPRPSQRAPNQPRSQQRREADKRRIAELYFLRQYSQAEIAEIVGIDQSTVSREIKTMLKDSHAQRIDMTQEYVDKVRLELRSMRAEMYEAWLRSCKPKTKKSLERGPNGQKQTLTVEGELPNVRPIDEDGNVLPAHAGDPAEIPNGKAREGNPAFIARWVELFEAELKVTGFVQKIALTTPDGTQPYEPRLISDAQLEAIIKRELAERGN